MAVALAVPMVEAAIAAAPNILAAGSMAAEMAERFGPKVKGAVNHLFHLAGKKRSAVSYLKRLGTRKGLKHFITRDIGKALKKGGETIAHVGAFANEVSNMTGQGSQGGALGAHAHMMASTVSSATAKAKRYHEVTEGDHDRGRNMVSPLKSYRF